jgi:serine/threonine-protein kinase
MQPQNQLNIVGTMLGQYKITALIYFGNVIAVYRAYQASLNRSVVIQTLVPHLQKDDEARQAFLRSAQIIAELEHPNIVPVLDYAEDKTIPYIVTRLMLGERLSDKLNRGRLAIPTVVQLVKQIGDVLDYVHSIGKTHGDINKNAIVFDGWGSAYLADFLIAGFQSYGDGIKGTPHYMATERWALDKATPQSDQYSLAIIAYQCLTGSLPFNNSTLIGMMNSHTSEPVPLPQTIYPEVPLAVNNVLLRALAKQPDERYPTVRDFVREFEKSLTQPPNHIFISYSRRDIEYATRLKNYFLENGLPVWIDDQIEHGDHWFNEINEAIKSCGAFVVVMSPHAEESEWVQKELLLAKRYKKIIFPLLLDGDEFPILIDVQYGDVRGNTMPDTEFHRRISRTIFGQ